MLEQIVGGSFEQSIRHDEYHKGNEILLIGDMDSLDQRVTRRAIQQFGISLNIATSKWTSSQYFTTTYNIRSIQETKQIYEH